MAPKIAIVSFADDLHARLVQATLRERRVKCSLIPADCIAASGALNWQGDGSEALLPAVGEAAIRISEFDLVWWRRAALHQTPQAAINLPESERDLVDSDCQGALLGVMQTAFTGRYINDPGRTWYADNKIVQCNAARRLGLRIPDTLVSQDPVAIKMFWQKYHGRLIVKPVRGTRKAVLMTRQVTPEDLKMEESLSLSPAIYQELIEGTDHLRVQVFGRVVCAARIRSTHLDWRVDYSSPMEQATIGDNLQQQLVRLLQHLGLRMGVFDLKIDVSGEPVWLELNPQGQFLFLEPLAGMSLLDPFVDFLLREALEVKAICP